jgi:hypothetical protein
MSYREAAKGTSREITKMARGYVKYMNRIMKLSISSRLGALIPVSLTSSSLKIQRDRHIVFFHGEFSFTSVMIKSALV